MPDDLTSHSPVPLAGVRPKAPLTGTILDVNAALTNDPSLVNTDPMGRGWLFRLRITHPEEIDQLWSKSQYEASLR